MHHRSEIIVVNEPLEIFLFLFIFVCLFVVCFFIIIILLLLFFSPTIKNILTHIENAPILGLCNNYFILLYNLCVCVCACVYVCAHTHTHTHTLYMKVMKLII